MAPIKTPIPANSDIPLEVGNRVQFVPEWQDPGDEEFERFVIEAPTDSSRVLVSTHIPGMTIQPTAWVEAIQLRFIS